MVSSLDGFIARPDNSVSWLQDEGPEFPSGASPSPEEITAFLKTIDCYVMGSRTFEHALELGWPYGETPVVVLSRRSWPAVRPTVEFHAGDPAQLLRQTLAPRFRNIWLVGGADVGQQFLARGLVDEIRLTLAPVLLGAGLRLFAGPLPESRWRLAAALPCRNGFVELTYARAAA